MRLRLTRRLIPFIQLALASCGEQTTGVGSREPVAEEHSGYRLEYIAADRAVVQSLVPMTTLLRDWRAWVLAQP